MRSVQTLPAYMERPSESERVLGREGERAGVDTVIEFPETAEEAEQRREEEMEGLYQLRVSRRAQQAAREARRAARQAARERGDSQALHELRSDAHRREGSAATNASNVVEPIVVEVTPSTPGLHAEDAGRRAGSRERRISSVSYADVGLARADGTRVRASSMESSAEMPLLSGAVSMASTTDEHLHSGASTPRRNSAQSQSEAEDQHDPRSTSALSMSTTISQPPETSQDIDSAATSAPPRTSLDHDHDHDHGHDLPGYDEAPPYETPSRMPPRLPSVRIGLPAIQVTLTAASPASSTQTTPVTRTAAASGPAF